jgi:threonine/homoserine/homoserine lactone efflux protein
MDELQAMLIAGLTGFVSGILLCIPVGPINLIILNEGTRRGFLWPFMIGLGATLMEMIYCFLAFTGFASFFQKGLVKAGMELCSFIFLLVIGIKFLTAKSVDAPLHISAKADKLEQRIEERFHPSSAFMIGFVRVLANPAVLLCWVILAANFISREWVTTDWPSKLSCIGGVALSIGGWFTGLSWLSSLGYQRISPKALLRMERVSGLILIGLALAHGVRIVWQMAKHAN